jgi:hypothetical protein
LKCEKFTEDRRQAPDAGLQVMAIVHLDKGPGELKSGTRSYKLKHCFVKKINILRYDFDINQHGVRFSRNHFTSDTQ